MKQNTMYIVDSSQLKKKNQLFFEKFVICRSAPCLLKFERAIVVPFANCLIIEYLQRWYAGYPQYSFLLWYVVTDEKIHFDSIHDLLLQKLFNKRLDSSKMEYRKYVNEIFVTTKNNYISTRYITSSLFFNIIKHLQKLCECKYKYLKSKKYHT